MRTVRVPTSCRRLRCASWNTAIRATSIDVVARSLGATKGMIYHHYPSKTDLFIAVYSRGMDINFEAVEPFLGDEQPVRRLENMARAHAVTMMAQQAFQRTVATRRFDAPDRCDHQRAAGGAGRTDCGTGPLRERCFPAPSWPL